MIRKRIISKSFASLFLVLMLYMNVCAAWCAIGSHGCCSKYDSINKKSCCKNEKDSGSKGNGCQDMHLSFFSVTGQFGPEKDADAPQVFQSLVAILTTGLIIQPSERSKNVFAYASFHPPPFKEDIRISISSFQI
ncbi:MAG: hypothetical protein ABIO46_04005 [Chitinophagales bacterium]